MVRRLWNALLHWVEVEARLQREFDERRNYVISREEAAKQEEADKRAARAQAEKLLAQMAANRYARKWGQP